MFAYRLAHAMGIVNVEDEGGLLDLISPRQLDGWMAYDLIEPIGPERLHDQLALIAAVLWAAITHCDMPDDLLEALKCKPKPPRTAAEQLMDDEARARLQIAQAEQIARRHNGA